MTRLRAPKLAVREVPVFSSGELSALEKGCRGSTFAARRDAAIIAVLTATGIRLTELAGIRYHPGDPARSNLDLHTREIRIAGKAGKPRTVRIGHQAARSLDRYLRARTWQRQPYGRRAVLIALARALQREPVRGLRVMLVSAGAEEALQEGIRGFARRYFPDLPPSSTFFLNLDAVGSGRLVLLEGEGPVRMRDYDRALKDLVAGCAMRRGYRCRAGCGNRVQNGAGACWPAL